MRKNKANFSGSILMCLACFCLMLTVFAERCLSQSSNSSSNVSTLYFLGDAGELDKKASRLFQFVLAADSSQKHVIFLGDNIYPAGLHEKGHPEHESDLEKLRSQMSLVKNVEGVQFVPGNHDWGGDVDVQTYSQAGLKRLRSQQVAVDEYFKNTHSFAPRDGCPGPHESLFRSGRILTLDTQWLLFSGERKRFSGSECHQTNTEVYKHLKRSIEDQKAKYTVLVTHHPLLSYGVPFRSAGSTCPHGINCPPYRAMRERVLSELKIKAPLLCVAGHDHSLQVIDGSAHGSCKYFVVSGAMSNVTKIANSPDMLYRSSLPGFVRVKFRDQRRPLLEVFTVSSGPKKADYTLRLKID